MSCPASKVLPIFLSLCLILTGCASSGAGSKYTAQQKQQLETNVLESSYDNAFNATRTVFLNEGLVLQQVDKSSGFINGTFDVKKSRVTGGRIIGTIFATLLAVVTFGLGLILIPFMYGDRGSDQFAITATLTKIDNQSVEIRLQTPLLEAQSENYGMALKRIFAEIQKQTMILDAAGRA
ncbi:MAG: hypothetical protein BWY44_00797 [Candidatus Omnitrophica bacterium ADurb.Bin292]|nr:MAG: hypothetical protein BWY44_00797 [Candidatus Omnitrophica bacterium ADurb.Bin292]